MSLVDVRSLDRLEALRIELRRYGADAEDCLVAVEPWIDQVLQRLDERRRHWLEVVRHCDEEYRRARAALRACQNAPSDDRGRAPDCSALDAWVRQAGNALRDAEAELHTVQHWLGTVRQAAQEYRREAGQLRHLLEYELPRARAFLGRKIATLRAYVSLFVPYGGHVASSGPLLPTATHFVPPAPLLAADAPSTSAPAVAEPLTAPDGSWLARGIQDVPLGQIVLDDSFVRSAADFHKVSYEVMVVWPRLLEEVIRPAVWQGADGDDFTALDARAGLDYEHGHRRVYDAFYGGDPVRLEWTGDGYRVVDGYHRLFVARELGLATIPASVVLAVGEGARRGDDQ